MPISDTSGSLAKKPQCSLKGFGQVPKAFWLVFLTKISQSAWVQTGHLRSRPTQFFNDVNWHKLLQRKHTTSFKPDDAMTVFWVETPSYKWPEVRQNFEKEIVYREWGTPGRLQTGRVKKSNSEMHAPDNASSYQPEDDGWELVLVWEPTSYQFYFKNCFTTEISPGRLPDGYSGLWSIKRSSSTLPPADFNLVSTIFEYGTDLSLNVPILCYNQAPADSDTLYVINLTPLEWAVEHGRLDLVRMFLDNGADANFTTEKADGPALVKAVRRNQELVRILVQKTDRVDSTRALCLAVEKHETAIMNILLANVRCTLKTTAFTPPLARAVERGNADIVRKLLKHGANANAAYHSMHSVSTHFRCGRIIQAAMERGHVEIVQLLLDGGADTNIAHAFWLIPIWPVPCHSCEPTHRDAYVEVKAGLKTAVAARRRGKREACSERDWRCYAGFALKGTLILNALAQIICSTTESVVNDNDDPHHLGILFISSTIANHFVAERS
ncbi:hypothetical protein AJ79_07334 [Helicocarpus griseus UAMH5409]|uniref:Uncharacterized protein n=1 Tax=Helicocarpus griseus UAMH5409 TaxID=1447875 RepID=A0A2B7X3T1_9EURO|nr:hypothetical protein AJ79_07334 [Helicocarpus griseus UAMH5409]